MPDSTDNTDPKRRKAIPAFCIIVVLTVLYVLSYAPVVRYWGVDDRFIDSTLPGRQISGSIAFYKPVDWLIDHTRLHDPLIYWADVWGVKNDFAMSELDRIFGDIFEPP